MIIDNLNLNLIRVFECVYRTKSMTKAAKELHMTQSGVSQNIKNLEDILQVRLFDRVKQRPIPTYKAQILFDYCATKLYDLESCLASIKGQDQAYKGEVYLGLPLEYGNNIVLPLLAQWGRKNPYLNYNIQYGHSPEMNSLLLRGEIDFAFVDTYGLDKQIVTEKVAEEELLLCASQKYIENAGGAKIDRKFFETLDYIDYVTDAPLLNSWFKHHLNAGHFNGRMRGCLKDVTGMSTMIINGLGVGILPSNVVQRLKSMGQELYVFEGKAKPLYNVISIAYVQGRSLNPAARATIDFLKAEIQAPKEQV